MSIQTDQQKKNYKQKSILTKKINASLIFGVLLAVLNAFCGYLFFVDGVGGYLLLNDNSYPREIAEVFVIFSLFVFLTLIIILSTYYLYKRKNYSNYLIINIAVFVIFWTIFVAKKFTICCI